MFTLSPQKKLLLQHFAHLLRRLERRIQALENLSKNFSRARLAFALLGAALVYVTSEALGSAWAWSIFFLLVIGFAVIAQRHDRVERSLARHRIWHRLKSEHVARAALAWENLPQHAAATAPSTHPFATDLNVSGERSMLHLLDNATSAGGSERLREWLLRPAADAEAIHARQEIVRELKPLARFRDRLGLQGALLRKEAGERWEGEKLLAWLEREANFPRLRSWVLGLGVLAVINLALFVLRYFELVPLLWPYTVLAYAYAYVLRLRELGRLFDEAFHLEKSLRPLQTVARYLEHHPYVRHPHLMQLCAPFREAGSAPSRHLKRVARIAQGASMQRGQVFWLLLNLLVPWDFYFWFRLEQAKRALKTRLPMWLEAWYELEAYNALANFAYLNPDYVFPEAQPAQESAILRARALGHPLLPEAARVSNDFEMRRLGEIALITGSNMSGKSTFLRAVGLNLCLAYCGAPVCAAHLQTVPLRLFTCMAVSDSVTDGISFFYAEVKRLKALLHELRREEQAPLFFLVDEIFKGTNNRERLIGSRAYIRALAQERGCGMISTHDLELVELAFEIATLRNYHFRESVREGRMIFDFLLREGPCPTTNALKIMELEGLPIA